MLEIINNTPYRINRSLLQKVFKTAIKNLRKKAPYAELIFINEKLSAKLNALRGKSIPTNILTFPEKGVSGRFSSGQIFITPKVVKEEAKNTGQKYSDWLLSVFIHGILHLYGFDHKKKSAAAKMDFWESKIKDSLGKKGFC